MNAGVGPIEIITNSIVAVTDTLDLYHTRFDSLVPWNKLEQISIELNRFRDDYSKELRPLVASIQKLLREGRYEYHDATQPIYEWCDLILRTLPVFVSLFDDSLRSQETMYEQQKQIIIALLHSGSAKLSRGYSKMSRCSFNLNAVVGKIFMLQNRFAIDFKPESAYFKGLMDKIFNEHKSGVLPVTVGPFGLVSEKIDQVDAFAMEMEAKFKEVEDFFEGIATTVRATNYIIDETRYYLTVKATRISELIFQNTESKIIIPLSSLLSLYDAVAVPVEQLLLKCEDYQRRHGKVGPR